MSFMLIVTEIHRLQKQVYLVYVLYFKKEITLIIYCSFYSYSTGMSFSLITIHE